MRSEMFYLFKSATLLGDEFTFLDSIYIAENISLISANGIKASIMTICLSRCITSTVS